MLGQLALTVLLLIGRSSSADDHPVMGTPLGKVEGYTMTSRSGQIFMAFSGIPYAKPPVGQLRFQPPEPQPRWDGIKYVKEDGPFCIQYSPWMNETNPVFGVEDCLYLSVYTKNISGSMPVLVHFHGGGFVQGNGNYAQPHYLMDEEVVVVNVNHRLGIYGFLTFETPDMPGNQGMKDQVMALRWVQENIASFGGDPNSVTITGESSGGASVYHHIVSPLSRGLFHRGIAESGTSYSTYAVTPKGFGRSMAEKLMKLIGCPTNQKDAMPCIMKKNPYEVVHQVKHFEVWNNLPILNFGPVFETSSPKAFLVGPISKWEHNPVPLFMGMTSAESLELLMSFVKNETDFTWLSENFDRIAPYILWYFASASNPDEVTKEVRRFYIPNKELSMNDWLNLTKLFTDGTVTSAVLQGADKHKGNVYFYYFDYLSKTSEIPPELEVGAEHVAEAAYVWNCTLTGCLEPANDEDLKLSKTLVKLWIGFAKTGIPTIEGSDIEWKTWSPGNHNYVNIGRKGVFELRKGLAEDRYKFSMESNYRDKFYEEATR